MYSIRLYFITSLFLVFGNSLAVSAELLTNSARFSNAPSWLNMSRVNRVAEPVQNFMEWSIRRAEVIWYDNQKTFEAAHGLGPYAVAVTRKKQNQILLGPKVNSQNFDQIFGHELVHIVSGQKYKDAIPSWLEEGVANHIAKVGRVDYSRLLPYMPDFSVLKMGHPMSGDQAMIHDRYMLSQALTEMLVSRCDFRNLLRLSVQRKMEDYLDKICRIPDLNVAFKKWVTEKAKK